MSCATTILFKVPINDSFLDTHTQKKEKNTKLAAIPDAIEICSRSQTPSEPSMHCILPSRSTLDPLLTAESSNEDINRP